MVKTKKTGKNESKARKAPAKLKRAVPPPDKPSLRYKELISDRVFGSEGKKLGQLRTAALEAKRQMASFDENMPVPATPGMSNWVPLGPAAIPNGQTSGGARVLVSGRVTAIVVDPTNPQIIYVGAARGGIWKTTDGGKNWVPKTDHKVSLAIGALAIAPSNPQIVYAGTGEGNLERYVQTFPLVSAPDNYLGDGVLKSIDGGDSWTQQGSSAQQGEPNFDGAGFFRMAVHPTNPDMAYAATSAGLFGTSNGGAHWAQMTSGLPAISSSIIAATDVVIDPASPKTVYVAFWGDGVYKTTNGDAANPVWTMQTGALPKSGIGRIALAISPSSSLKVYALFADDSEGVLGLYETVAGGWSQVSVSLAALGGSSSYTMNVAVDPTTPDIVHLSDVSLYKVVRNPVASSWSITEIGANIHPDNHCFAFDPTNHLIVYAGNDGGIYKSSNGGMSWTDSINRGLCITQFEFIDQHPTSDALVIGGTQDNGTEQFRNSPVFYHSDEGDGGFVAIDSNQPSHMLHGYYSVAPAARSTVAGSFGSWMNVSVGLLGPRLFYAPFALDQSNPNNVALGTDRMNLDAAQGTGGWPVKVTLPGITGRVSAISYVNSNLIHAATSAGGVYRLVKTGGTWSVTAVHAAPLPGRWIWDIAVLPGNVTTVILVMAGYGTGHVWRGAVPASGNATWTDIGGTGTGRLPDVPVNALVIEPAAPNTMYVGTDIGVFRTTNGGNTWALFSDGLPNCAVYDLRLHQTAHLLRAGTHGRGLWERKLDSLAMPDVNIFVRDNLMDTGRFTPSPSGVTAAFEDVGQHAALGDLVWWWQCADIKIDALEGSPLSYQWKVADVDYVAFESKLQHRNPQRGRVNRIYVEVHNRGIQPAAKVTVKILYADAAAGLPDLPPDFWTAFPGDSADLSGWKPIVAAKVIPSLSPTEPAILEWDWNTPTAGADHSCLLVVTDCPDDPIPAANKIFKVGTLVRNEKRVGLKNLHVVGVVPGMSYWTPFQCFGNPEHPQVIRIYPSSARRWSVGLLFPKKTQKGIKLDGFTRTKPTKGILNALRARIDEEMAKYDTTALYMVDHTDKGGTLAGVAVPKEGLQTMLLLVPPSQVTPAGTVTIAQELGQSIVGGSTFVLRTLKKT